MMKYGGSDSEKVCVKLEIAMCYVAVEEKKAGAQVTGLSEFQAFFKLPPATTGRHY
jgi:hypothetical protein